MASLQSLKEDNSQVVTNPYTSRIPVTNPDQFYGRRSDILRVAESIRSWQPFSMSGEPRIGKTSLLYYLIHREGARALPGFLGYIGNPANYLFVLVELQRLPVRSVPGFWRYLLDRLVEEARETGLETRKMQEEYDSSQELENDHYQVQISFESYLKQLRKKVVFFFDDFDIVINDCESTEVAQVTDKLRALKEGLDFGGRLNYVIMSTDPLARLFEAKGISNRSPLTSIINLVTSLGLLEEEATTELVQEPLRRLSESVLPFSREETAFVYKLAGRHPDFMKIVCSYLFAMRGQDYSSIRQQIEDDLHVRGLMKRLWERVKREGPLEELPLREMLLQIAQGQQPPNSSALHELRQRGFIDDSTSPPHIFGDLFCNFILRPSSLRPVMAIELTSLESKLYNYLVEHVGHPCSRVELQKVLWGDKVPRSPDALEQLVKRVRGKIEPLHNQPMYLLNVRGQGYLLRSVPPRSL